MMKQNWKKIATWAAAAIALVWLLIIPPAYMVQQKTSVHRYLLAKMIQAAESSTGARINIGEYAVRWLPLRITLRDVIVRGTEKDPARPLASVAQAEIGVAWGACPHKRFDLTELILERPAIHLIIDDAAQSNLPARLVAGPGSQTADS